MNPYEPYEVEWVPTTSVRPADWRAGHILHPDLKLLAHSMTTHGWLTHLVVRRSDAKIIDGFHRWLVAGGNKGFARAHDASMVPVLWVDCDEIDARVMHVQLNRARGVVVAKYLSLLVRDVLRSGKYDKTELRSMFHMGLDEMDLMVDGSLLKTRKIAEHTYSKAWVPVEAPPQSATVAPQIVLERPPNAGR